MAKRGFVGILLAGASLALLPQLAAAQEIRDLDREASNVRSFAGVVGDGPALFETDIAANSALRIEVITTSGLDPTVKVTDAATGEVLAEDDDSGGELNSRVTVRGPDAGSAALRVRIAVQAFNYEAIGEDQVFDGERMSGSNSFDLRLTTLAHNPQSARSISWGTAVGGTLLGEETHEFTFQGEAGKVLDVLLLAGEESGLDPYLELKDQTGEVIASNDDSGGGLNSRIRHVMQGEGPYTIVAKAYGDSTGEYTLRVAERREAVVQAPLQVIGIGDTTEGRLGEGYENGGIEPAFIDYQLSDETIAAIAAGGGQITIRMEKGAGEDPAFDNSLDPYIQLGFDTPLGFAGVDSDDDSGGDLNAMLPIDLSSIGSDPALLARLRIRAQAVSSSGGNYVLRVTDGMEPRPVDEVTIETPMPVFD